MLLTFMKIIVVILHFLCLHQIDLLQPLEAQGPFSVIIHKLTDVLSLAHDGDKKSQMMMDNLKVPFLSCHPPSRSRPPPTPKSV